MEKITLGPMPYMSVMPTLLVGANVKGKPNYMTAAWATVACMAPPMVCVAINKARYTARGIEENKTFSLNVPVRTAGGRDRPLRARLRCATRTSPGSSGLFTAN